MFVWPHQPTHQSGTLRAQGMVSKVQKIDHLTQEAGLFRLVGEDRKPLMTLYLQGMVIDINSRRKSVNGALQICGSLLMGTLVDILSTFG